jgi:hypothetical protein
MKDALPLARKDSLVIKQVENETLIYDLESDQAHCLNDTAARVWKRCDGRSTPREIATHLATEVNKPVDDKLVWLALDQLDKFKLLVKSPIRPESFSHMSRRQLVRNLGVAAIVLPMVTSLVVPAAAQSGSPSCCLNDSDCPAGQCCDPHQICPTLPSSKQCVPKILSNPPGTCP